ncbi:HigA family addiction module antitoxin [Paraburkholderia sp. SG-MS1]|uniref:HigA family addiction module antitoxin n=1 Tax=Paraburkholderia sp. SG-MS1 TaxID=2023741 RepID=UPI001EEA4EEA|nr:HigA family addiction module antitoxin [Paraburkholderia sp. SG-MS1]
MVIKRSALESIDLSAIDTGDTIPDIHPGEIVRSEFLEPLGMSFDALALALRVPAPRINDVVRGKRTISADTRCESSAISAQARHSGSTCRSPATCASLLPRPASSSNGNRTDAPGGSPENAESAGRACPGSRARGQRERQPHRRQSTPQSRTRRAPHSAGRIAARSSRLKAQSRHTERLKSGYSSSLPGVQQWLCNVVPLSRST